MQKFKAGDNVKVIKYCEFSRMAVGSIGTVVGVRGTPYVPLVKFEGGVHKFYNDFELELISETKVITSENLKIVFKPPYTIVIKDGITGKAKCNLEDEYDPIVGLELAMSRTKLKPAREIRRAFDVVSSAKWRLSEPKFKVGDYVRVREEAKTTENGYFSVLMEKYKGGIFAIKKIKSKNKYLLKIPGTYYLWTFEEEWLDLV